MNSASRNAERLVDLRDHLDQLVVEGAVGRRGDLGDELVGDRVAVLVERDLAGRRLEADLARAPLAASCRRRTGRRLTCCRAISNALGVDVVDWAKSDGDGKRIGQLLVGGGELLPCRRVSSSAIGPAEGVPMSDLARLALGASTFWSTVIEPPISGACRRPADTGSGS